MEATLQVLINEIKLLKELIVNNPEPKSFKSNSINELAAALSKAQVEFKIADLNKLNPYFQTPFADISAVVIASRQALGKYGLSVIQDIMTTDDGSNILHTILLHSSGQYIESRVRLIPPKMDIQTMYSYTNAMKRLAYSSLVGVVSDSDDDDGEAAVATTRELYAKGTALNTKYNAKEQSYESISKDQLEELEYELSEYSDIAEMILDGMKIQSLADLPKQKFLAAIKRIREIKLVRNSGK